MIRLPKHILLNYIIEKKKEGKYVEINEQCVKCCSLKLNVNSIFLKSKLTIILGRERGIL